MRPSLASVTRCRKIGLTSGATGPNAAPDERPMAGEHHQGCGLGTQDGGPEADRVNERQIMQRRALLGGEAALGTDQERCPGMPPERVPERIATRLVGEEDAALAGLSHGIEESGLGQQLGQAQALALLHRLDQPLAQAVGPRRLDHAVPAAHRLEPGHAELDRLLEQPFEPGLLQGREEQGRTGLGCRRAKLGLDRDQRAVPVEPVEPGPPFAGGGIEDPKRLAGASAEHGTQVVGRIGIELEAGPGAKLVFEMQSRVTHLGVLAFTPGDPDAK